MALRLTLNQLATVPAITISEDTATTPSSTITMVAWDSVMDRGLDFPIATFYPAGRSMDRRHRIRPTSMTATPLRGQVASGRRPFSRTKATASRYLAA